MDDTNIEILETESVIPESSVVALPMNFVSVGTVEHDSVQVYIKQDVYKRIEKFAKEEMSKDKKPSSKSKNNSKQFKINNKNKEKHR